MANLNIGALLGASGSSLNNISISGHSQAPWNVTFDDFGVSVGSHVKKYEILEIEEDLLALSVAWKRLRDAAKKGGSYVPVSKLLDKELFSHVTDNDREQANNIRNYYSKKIMMWKLKDLKLSNFREDMNSFIHTNGKMFKDSMLPMVYRLPEFHEYDVEFDNLVLEHNKIITNRKVIQTKTLELKKNFIVGKKYTKRKEYWFSDEDNNLVTFSLSHDNPLISLLDLQCKNPITLSGNYTIRHRDNNEYIVVEKYSFL